MKQSPPDVIPKREFDSSRKILPDPDSDYFCYIISLNIPSIEQFFFVKIDLNL
jgi:hypothetical protein